MALAALSAIGVAQRLAFGNLFDAVFGAQRSVAGARHPALSARCPAPVSQRALSANAAAVCARAPLDGEAGSYASAVP
ncbi:hypothetical protein AQ611_15100 [Burkholderia singularis]|nr:hypothetical protein AQ611_15100 [Burkholderia sp. Bp7605]